MPSVMAMLSVRMWSATTRYAMSTLSTSSFPTFDKTKGSGERAGAGVRVGGGAGDFSSQLNYDFESHIITPLYPRQG